MACPTECAVNPIRAALMLTAFPLLAACGGGGGSSSGGSITGPSTGSPANPNRVTAEGLWAGSTTDGRDVSLLVLGNGVFWTVYTAQPGFGLPTAPSGLGGMMQGSGTSTPRASDGVYSGSYSGSGTDFNFEGIGINAVTLAADYEPLVRMDGVVTYPAFAGSLGFSLVQTGGYEPAARLTDIAGNYSGRGRPANTQTGDEEDVTLAISTSGTISGQTQFTQCSFAGTISPRASGNVFDIVVQFNGLNCADSLASVSGVAFTSGTPGNLVALALNNARTDGFLFSGTRP